LWPKLNKRRLGDFNSSFLSWAPTSRIISSSSSSSFTTGWLGGIWLIGRLDADGSEAEAGFILNFFFPDYSA
jgi:hypothetical protein